MGFTNEKDEEKNVTIRCIVLFMLKYLVILIQVKKFHY